MRADRFAIPSIRVARAVACVAVLANFTGACRTKPVPVGPPTPHAEKQSRAEMTWQDQPMQGVAGQPAKPVAIREGVAPLVYLSEQPVTLEVTDMTSKQFVAEAVMAGRSILRVDERSGVVASGETLVPGPLPAGHRYSISVKPSSENISRQGTFEQRPVKP